jgi:hypothetical protein
MATGSDLTLAEQYLTVEQLASRWNVTAVTIERWNREKRLPAIVHDGVMLFDRRWVARCERVNGKCGRLCRRDRSMPVRRRRVTATSEA